MLQRFHKPAAQLAEFVEHVWACADEPSHPRERILPSGTIELVINLRDDEIRIYDAARPDRFRKHSGAAVSGPYAGAFIIDPSQHRSIMGVHFKPGGAPALLGVAASELTDSHVDLETLWGRSAATLRQRLCSAGTPHARFALIERALAARLDRPAPIGHAAVAKALELFTQPGAATSIREAARRVHLSQRRFIQLFARQVGLTPGLYCRILRFQRARDALARIAAPDWATLAVRCGYFDQSHLIRDFREFSGLTPTQYLRDRSDRVLRNHVPILPPVNFLQYGPRDMPQNGRPASTGANPSCRRVIF